MKNRRKKPKSPEGFVTKTHLRCEDCEYRYALRNEGRPMVVGGIPRTVRCEACGGRGELVIDSADKRRIDPYATGLDGPWEVWRRARV